MDSLYDVFYNGIEKLFNTVIFLYYLMVVPVFKTNDRLYTDKEFLLHIMQITYQFSFFVIILSMIGLLIGGVIGKNFKLRSKTPKGGLL